MPIRTFTGMYLSCHTSMAHFLVNGWVLVAQNYKVSFNKRRKGADSMGQITMLTNEGLNIEAACGGAGRAWTELRLSK